MKRLLAAIVLICACAPPAQAHHSWNNYRWDATVAAIELRFIDSTSEGVRRQHVLPSVLEEWDASEVFELSRRRGDNRRRTRRDCPIPSGKVRLCDANFGPGEFGHTDLALDGERIIGARILVNNYWGRSKSYRRFVICHEIGHSLGLDHQSGSSHSCLAGGQHPDEHDFDMLREIYSVESAAAPDDDCLLGVCQQIVLIETTIASLI